MHNYTHSLVGFYDILGFSPYVAQHPNAEDVYRLFSKVRDTFSFQAPDARAHEQRFAHFSDTVVRTTPMRLASGKENRFAMLFHEMLDASYLQIELIWREQVLVRGVITTGDVYHDETEVYGPGIIRAHLLEQETAIFPRIIVDPQLLAEFESNPTLRSTHNPVDIEREHCYDLLARDHDGLWFVDYLRTAESEADHEGMYPLFLEKHKKVILDMIGGKTDLNRIRHKYTWLAYYHNSVVEGFDDDALAEMGYSKERLLIDSKEAPLILGGPDSSRAL